jgi:hypothetical protein
MTVFKHHGWSFSICLCAVLFTSSCKSKEPSIYTDQQVINKCRQIKKNSECGLDYNSTVWLNETDFSLVSRQQKDLVVGTVTKVIARRENPDYSRAFALSFIDADYAFEPLSRLRKSPCSMARCKVAAKIPLTAKYKDRGTDMLVGLLFDEDRSVRMSTACSIAQRLESDEAVELLLLYYFENIYNNYDTAHGCEHFCYWVRFLAKSKYRAVLLPWIEHVTQLKPNSPPLHEWSHYDPPGTWDKWMENAKAEQSEAIAKATKIVARMKQHYKSVLERPEPVSNPI